MKKLLLFLLLAVFVNNIFSQPDARNGYYLPTKGIFRILVVFAEATGDPQYNTIGRVDGWNAGQMPPNPCVCIDLISTNYKSYIGRYYNEISFGELKIIGDYHPNLIRIPYDSIPNKAESYTRVFEKLSALCNGGHILTARGLYFPDDFDSRTLPSSPRGQQKTPPTPDNKIDCILIYWRVNSKLGAIPVYGNFVDGEKSISIGP